MNSKGSLSFSETSADVSRETSSVGMVNNVKLFTGLKDSFRDLTSESGLLN